MRSFTRRLLNAARIWDYLLGRPAGHCPPVRPTWLGLEQCEAREQPGSMLDGFLAAAFGGVLADPFVAMTGVVGTQALLARPTGDQLADVQLDGTKQTGREVADEGAAVGLGCGEAIVISSGSAEPSGGPLGWARTVSGLPELGESGRAGFTASMFLDMPFLSPILTAAGGEQSSSPSSSPSVGAGGGMEGAGLRLPASSGDGLFPMTGQGDRVLPSARGDATKDGSLGGGPGPVSLLPAADGGGLFPALEHGPTSDGEALPLGGGAKKGSVLGGAGGESMMMLASLGTDTPVNTYTTSFQYDPAVAADADGNFVIAWRSSGQDGSGDGIYAQRYSSSGTAQGSEFRVNTYTTDGQRNPAVAMDANGDFVVAWESSGQEGTIGVYGVYAQRYSANGTAQGSEFRVNTYTTGGQSDPSVAMDASGNFVIAWMSDAQEGGFGLQGIYAQRYSANGTAQGSEFHVNTYTTNAQLYPSVAMDADGDFAVAWDSFGQDGSDFGIYAQRYSSNGTAQSSEFRVNTYTTNAQYEPSAAMDAVGNFVVTWSGAASGDSSGIYAQRYTANGTALGSEFLVNTYTTNAQSITTVAMDADGDFVLTWQSSGQDGSGNGIYAQRYAANGTTLGSEFRVNTYTTNGQSNSAVAVDAVGNFVIAWEGEGTQDTSGIYMAISAQLPRAFVPDWAASASSSIGGSASGVGANNPGMTSAGRVRYADGTVALSQTDLWSDGYGIGWGQARSWTNGAGYAPRNVNGNGMVNTQQPFLLKDTDGTTIAVVRDGTRADYYDLVGSVWTERFFGQDKLTYNSGSAEYVLTDTLGHVTKFHDFSTGITATQRGGLKGFTDNAGNAITVTYTTGVITEMSRVVTVGATTVTESLAYTYLTSPDVNAGLVATATLQRKVGAGSFATVRSVAYAYYNGVESYGNLGDLKTAVVKDASANAIDTTYHRYYTTGEANGYKNGLKYLVGGEAFDRMTNALGTTLASISNTQLAPYADLYLEYDSAHRVTKERIAGGGGALSALAGQGEYTYVYTASANAAGTNAWAMKTVETLPDGTTNTVYTNAYGQVMLAAYTASAQVWSTFYKYDAAGRTTLVAAPSAVSGYSDTYADLVNYTAGNAQYLRDSDGLLAAYTYASSTTATTSVAGDATGYLKQAAITHGETGTAIPQEAMSYIKRTAGSVDFFFMASDTVYRNDNGTGAQTTSYSYTWQGATAQPDSITVTLPVVTTAQNGSNSANTMTTVYDAFRRSVWGKDESGFITYTQFDTPTGSVVKTITDVDTDNTGDFTNLPSGWSAPNGLHLLTAYEVDSLGRVTKATSPEGRIDYTVYDDTDADGDPHEVRYYAGWNTFTNAPTGPTVVMRNNRANGYTETLTMSATPAITGGRPTGTESISALQSLSRGYVNAVGQTINSDAYFNLSGLTYSTSTSLGTEGTHFYRSESAYDTRGRWDRTLSTENTIYRMVYDGLSRSVSQWVGTDDTPTSGTWSPTNTAGTNLVKVTENEYDGGGIGDSNLTKVTAYPGGGAAARVTQTWFDWRNRAVTMKDAVEGTESTSVNRPIVYLDFDNLSEVTKSRVYDGDTVTPTVSGGVPVAPSASLLRAQDTMEYDELGRVFQTKTFSVNTTSGAVSTNSLITSMWYDARGLTIKQSMPNGLVQKAVYDGAGRTTTTYLGDWGGDASYSDADDVSGDTVVEQSVTTYDKDSNTLSMTNRQRFHDASGTGALGSPSSGIGARVSYTGYYYDFGSRLTGMVNVGTNGGTAWSRPSTLPSPTATELVTSYFYDAAGRLFEVTDPAERVMRMEYDALGRTTKTIENYVNGTVSDTDDKTTTFAYNGVGRTSLTAHLTGGGVQTTEWAYGVTVASGSTIESNDIVGVTKWPDPTTGAASSSEQETMKVNAVGQAISMTDRNGTTHELTFDALGRVAIDKVTAFGTGVDQTVKRIETAHVTRGDAVKVTSYDATSGGTILTEVLRDFNGLGQMITEWQSHSGAVVTSTTPKVQYAYNFNGSGTTNQSRLTSMTYPSGYALTFNYSSGLNSAISRLSSLSDSSGSVESYDYLGLGGVVRRAHSQPNVDLSYIKRTGESNGDAGDQYTGLDRFGRVVDQRWLNPTTGTATDRFQYGYDEVGKRLYRDNLVNTAFGELYTYDNLDQLATFKRGTLNGTKDAISGTASRTQDWNHDALGNWDSLTTDGTAQNRSANKQNEITSISGATTPTYDANGNMTTDETGKQFVYDAWNRLVTVKDSGGTTLKTYKYDGLNHRVSETAGGTTTDLYYSANWQVLEEKVGSNTTNRYVWSPVYVDAMILRDRDTDGNGTLDERLWVQQDANFNVTALVNGSGTVVERYAYDSFGAVTVYDASYTVRTSSSYGWNVLWQGMVYDSVSGSYKSRERTDISPTLGRPFQPDPIRFAAGDVNFYRWESNTPTNRLDPLGLDDNWKVKWEWHHMFPNDFQKQFPNFDFDAIDNGRLVRGGPHRGEGNSIHSKGWNDDWDKWIKEQNGRPITPESIKAHATKMMNSDKYKGLYEGSTEVAERYNVRAARLATEKAAREAAEKLAKESAEKGAKGLGPIVKKAGWVGKRIPGVGIGVAILFWPADVQAKGWVGGTANSLLDAVPFGGTVKGGIELRTGDLIPDKGEKSPIESLIPSIYPFNTPQVQLPSREAQLRGDYDYRRNTLFSPTLGQFRMQPSSPPRR